MEKTTMTQKELDDKLRNLSIEESELLKIHDENTDGILNKIRQAKVSISTLQVSLSLYQRQHEEALRERKNIKQRYNQKRKELIGSSQIAPGINNKLSDEFTLHQIHAARRLFRDALVAELADHDYPNLEAVKVEFQLSDSGNLRFLVVIPSEN